jgi:Flp pilus assembly protein TadG
MTTRSTRLRGEGDVGAATVWMVFGTTIVLAVAGLVYDGGNLIAAKRSAIDDAEETARAGAQAIDPASIRLGGPARLDPDAAVASAQQFLTTNGWTGTVSADTTTVTVTISRQQSPTFLHALGVGSKTVNGTATARPHQGLARR